MTIRKHTKILFRTRVFFFSLDNFGVFFFLCIQNSFKQNYFNIIQNTLCEKLQKPIYNGIFKSVNSLHIRHRPRMLL